MNGKKNWFIPDCYLPEVSNGNFVSHESICVLNTGDKDATIKLTLYFEDKDPIVGFKSSCNAKRTHHIRLDKIRDEKGNKIPLGVPYAIMVESSVDVICQYSRLDTTQKELALMTTIAY